MSNKPLPGLGAPLGPQAGPIQDDLHETMNALARGLDEIFNGPNFKPEDRKIGFFLAAFPFGDRPGARFNYISNADKLDVRATLADILARLEARMSQPGRA